MAVVRSTVKGQVLIPAEIRRRFNIRRGTSLNVYADAERIYLEPVSEDLVEESKGFLSTRGRVLKALLADRTREARQ